MGIAGSLMVLTIAWWIAFQAMLPLGIRSHLENDTVVPGTDPSAPTTPNLRRKAIYATLIAIATWALLYWLIVYEGVSLDQIPTSL